MSPRIRFVASVALWGIFCLETYFHHHSVRLPGWFFFLGMSAVSYMSLYITEKAETDSQERVGTITAYFFLLVAALGVLSYLFGVQDLPVRDVFRKLF